MTELERKQDRSPVPSGFDYAPAPESRDVVRLEKRYGLFIGGEFVESYGGRVHLASLREGYSTTRILQRLGAA